MTVRNKDKSFYLSTVLSHLFSIMVNAVVMPLCDLNINEELCNGTNF